jgi:hypothetical protein
VRPWKLAAALLLVPCLVPRHAAAQGHQHDAASRNDDPGLRLLLEGPHLVLAHRGYLGLSDRQIERLQLARKALCSAEVRYQELTANLGKELDAILTDGVQEKQVTAVLERESRARAAWLLALVQARTATSGQLNERQRQQALQLRDHWLREARAMIVAATHVGQPVHPGMQAPIRVPGMAVSETALMPFCEALHGPARHISIPPP